MRNRRSSLCTTPGQGAPSTSASHLSSLLHPVKVPVSTSLCVASYLQVKELEAAGERLQAALSDASSSLAPLEAERDRLAAQREEARAAMAAQVAEADKEVRRRAGERLRTAVGPSILWGRPFTLSISTKCHTALPTSPPLSVAPRRHAAAVVAGRQAAAGVGLRGAGQGPRGGARRGGGGGAAGAAGGGGGAAGGQGGGAAGPVSWEA